MAQQQHLPDAADTTTAEPLIPDDLMLEALAEFAAGAGHDINNPVAVILGRVQLLKRRIEHPADLEMLNAIGTQALRIRDMISDLMLYARPMPPSLETVNLVSLIKTCTKCFQDDQQTIEMNLDLPERAVATVDSTQFRIVLEELLANAKLALQSCEAPSICVDLKTCANESTAQNFWKLSIIDNGIGLTELQATHLFHPFYSGRPAGRGLGFGLPKCWQILKMHGGSLTAQRNSSAGMRFDAFWPIGQEVQNQPIQPGD